ncbi:ATP-grasp domain-containing protein [Streptomyces sp. NPDC051211]|uniref:ATP-grasp domain-containing protein n=1 Tax=Streptomyces sp. NPDC051211 TaxID=3154643 RepID=UPI00344BCFCC
MGRPTPVAVLLSPRPADIAAARRAGARTVVVAPVPPEPSDREGAVRQAHPNRRDHPAAPPTTTTDPTRDPSRPDSDPPSRPAPDRCPASASATAADLAPGPSRQDSGPSPRTDLDRCPAWAPALPDPACGTSWTGHDRCPVPCCGPRGARLPGAVRGTADRAVSGGAAAFGAVVAVCCRPAACRAAGPDAASAACRAAGPDAPSAPAACDAAVGRPFGPFCGDAYGLRATPPAGREAHGPAGSAVDGYLVVDWREHRELVRALSRLDAVRERRAAVFGFGDAARALAAARANEALGLRGTPVAAVTALMDKAALRARANTLHSTRPVSFARCGHASLLPFLATLIGHPCVIKPRAGADGEGVRLVRDPAEAAFAARSYPAVTDLLVEEFLEGPELGVEALSRDGRHRILGWTRSLRPADDTRLAPAGHDLPTALPAATAEAVRSFVRGVLDLAGHRDGPSRTEVVLTPHGPRLVEAHARPGGAEITQLLRLAHGTDVLALAVAAGLGLPGPAPSPRTPAHAGLRYVDFPPGHRLAGSRAGLAAARAVPGVLRIGLAVPPNATVRRPPTGTLHHAYVLAAAPTPADLDHALARAVSLLHT